MTENLIFFRLFLKGYLRIMQDMEQMLDSYPEFVPLANYF
jgi:hypothetical protein